MRYLNKREIPLLTLLYQVKTGLPMKRENVAGKEPWDSSSEQAKKLKKK
jgi:hypothetical protein